MRPEPFYASPDMINADRIVLDREERRHLVTVRRHRTGEQIVVVDGQGGVYTATISEIRANEVICRIDAMTQAKESAHFVLGVGVLKNPTRLDYMVEKSTELGANEIVLLETERTIATRVKVEHWNKLALAAMKQSGRAFLPRITTSVRLRDFLHTPGAGFLGLIPHERIVSPTLSQVMAHATQRSIRICIGPEGGFTDSEIQEAEQAGYQAVSLGENRLRTETAAVAAMAICAAARGKQSA